LLFRVEAEACLAVQDNTEFVGSGLGLRLH